MRRVAALALISVLAAGCGGEEPAGEGRLYVDKILARGPVYMEGSLTELVLRDDAGGTVLEMRPEVTGRGPLLDRALPAGRYRLVTRERPCQGSCGLLDPPVEGCEAELEIRPERTTHVQVRLGGAAGGGVSDCVTA